MNNLIGKGILTIGFDTFSYTFKNVISEIQYNPITIQMTNDKTGELYDELLGYETVVVTDINLCNDNTEIDNMKLVLGSMIKFGDPFRYDITIRSTDGYTVNNCAINNSIEINRIEPELECESIHLEFIAKNISNDINFV